MNTAEHNTEPNTHATPDGGVAVRNITVSFGANHVLRGIDLALHPGEVTAMLGANGAGKSTLIKVLSGVNTAYGGEVLIDGTPVRIDSPNTAREHGIQVVHQKISSSIVPGLSVAENLLFDGIVNNTTSRIASSRSMLPKARALTDVLDLDWSDQVLNADVFELSIADQQLLLLCRALGTQPRLLILDEPTAALSNTEAERLFAVIADLQQRGVAVFYVSHRLAEIDQIADRVVVLRDGVVRSEQRPPFDWPEALHSMLDAAVDTHHNHAELRGSQTVLTLDGVQLFERSRPFDLSIRAGEVTGVFGLLGSGGTELANGIFGAEPFRSGTMALSGEAYAPRGPHQAIARGVYMVHEDRMSAAIIGDWSVAMTSTFPFLAETSRFAVVDKGREQAIGEAVIAEYGVVAQGPQESMLALSGGNQQKVVVGRWLRHDPVVMVLNEPFQGVDVGARRDLVEKARQVAADGAAVVVMTTDLEEVMEVADRVIGLADGNPVVDRYLSTTTQDELLQGLSEVQR